MREKELRLAIVLTGGVSLAVYMYGVSKELLKLVRASKIYHSIPDYQERQKSTYNSLNDDPSRETDTEEIYFDLLSELSGHTELRIIIDVISGASAGGVNGVMLARALAHDLPLDAHRSMWLEHADVLELMDEKTKAGRWSKFYLEPFFRGPFSRFFKILAPDNETREKLFTFLKSRWFSPPFSGERFTKWMLDGADKMEEGRTTRCTLMPDGHELDLFVNVTDFQGHQRLVKLHDPGLAVETEHRLHLHFNFIKHPNGEKVSDFDRHMIPSLIFAARATSSFPGMFPAMTFKEIDKVLSERGQSWGGREEFLNKNFKSLYRGGRNPERAFFIDGSTVNDKPFATAIGAIAGRPAHREVARRLLFIDPEADAGEISAPISPPNMFRTLLGALMEIPRNEPVRDELERLNDTNKNANMIRHVIELSRPNINKMVGEIIGDAVEIPSIETISKWRTSAHKEVAKYSGMAFDSYFRLKILRVISRIERLITDLAEDQDDGVKATITGNFRKWANQNIEALKENGSIAHPKDIAFLKAYDVDFYIRRLRFVIQKLNSFYHTPLDDKDEKHYFSSLDRIKNALYAKLSQAIQLWDARTYSEAIKKKAERIFEEEDGLGFLTHFLSSLKKYINLKGLDREADEIFSVVTKNNTGPNTRKELFLTYIGFSFFDLLSFPLVQQEDLTELDEVLIHRISPKDAKALYFKNRPLRLKGKSLRNFGGFFNRSFREHDYLSGRLSAADRLVDMILDVEPGIAEKVGLDVPHYKKRLFERILEAEVPFLSKDPDLISGFRDRLLKEK